ncbi:MAG: glycerol-3-phosphate 1-O-acyltransferase PlsY [Clostridiales bacterium]|nr:glycerol-3-phosphate 1-O-acyltransferase PlsY [Clostridiales bacterium]
MAPFIIIILTSYLIGSISFSIIISKRVAGIDVREKGSGNAGTTNVLRSVGKGAAGLTLLGDVSKGVVAILLAMLAGVIWKDVDVLTLKYLAGFVAIVGHTYPVFFGFKGGKGVATALGVLLMLNWKVGLICLIFAIVIIAVTRMVSVGSLLAAILFPILIIFIETEKNFGMLLVSILIALLVIFNHRSNIKRIKEGNENKLSFK